MLDSSHINYTVIDAEENSDLTAEYGIQQAPTLVVAKDGAVEKYINASNIKKYAKDYTNV